MDGQMRSQVTGGAVFVLCGIIVLVVGAPGLLGLLLIVVGMVMLGLSVGGFSSIPEYLRSRRRR